MNRMALLCSFAVVGLTAAALVQHRQESVAPEEPAKTPDLGASAPTGEVPTQLPEVAPRVDLDMYASQIRRQIVEPITASFLERVRFSRARHPARELHLRMREPTEERAPREDAREFVLFDIEQSGGRFDRSGKRHPFIYGRITPQTGAVELALVRKGTENVFPRAWQPAAEVLRRLGVKPGQKPALTAKQKRHW